MTSTASWAASPPPGRPPTPSATPKSCASSSNRNRSSFSVLTLPTSVVCVARRIDIGGRLRIGLHPSGERTKLLLARFTGYAHEGLLGQALHEEPSVRLGEDPAVEDRDEPAVGLRPDEPARALAELDQ